MKENNQQNNTLSSRRADTVANFLNGKGKGRIAAAACRYKTPEQVAVMYLGGRAGSAEVKRLTAEIYKVAGLSQGENNNE